MTNEQQTNEQRHTFLDGYKENFDTLQQAVRADRVVLMETRDAKTGQLVATVAAVNYVNGEYEFVPLAKLFDGNPYEELQPPNPEGGFFPVEQEGESR